MDIYFVADPNIQTIELKNFVFWDEFVRSKLLQSMYRMDQIIELCEINDKRFVRNIRPNNRV